MLEVHQFPCLSDNYGYLIHDTKTLQTATIDTPEVEPINRALKEKGWKLTHILNTHHHFDHSGGNIALKEQWACLIVGSKSDASRIPGIDIEVDDGDVFTFGEQSAEIFDVSGHTQGHIAFFFKEANMLFSGDALFSLGCGRLFEGSAEQMWHSLNKLMQLPNETLIYCAHEYTQANARFALSVEPENEDLQKRAKEIDELRTQGKPTVPSSLALEKATNPFLRPDSRALQENIGFIDAELLEIFAETRRLKDSF